MEEKTEIQAVFGQLLVELRKEKKQKQAELAEKSQMDVTYISDLERGVYMPSLHTVLKLARGLEVNLEDIASRFVFKYKI